MFVNGNILIYINVKSIKAQQCVQMMLRNEFWEGRCRAVLSIFVFVSWIFFRFNWSEISSNSISYSEFFRIMGFSQVDVLLYIDVAEWKQFFFLNNYSSSNVWLISYVFVWRYVWRYVDTFCRLQSNMKNHLIRCKYVNSSHFVLLISFLLA